MNARAADLWDRAKDALQVARHDLAISPDAAASRAYYAAFYAVSARFALAGRTFKKHSAVEAAVHRDLVNTGAWPTELGHAYSRLVEARTVGDYGEGEHVASIDAAQTVEIADEILRAIAREHSEEFTGLEDQDRPLN